MSDEKIRAVLRRAAEDRAFHDALMENREATLDSLELTPAEKAVLMAPAREQLEKMIRQAGKPPRRSGALLKILGGAAAAALGVGFVTSIGFSTGVTREVHYEHRALHTLKQIAQAEELYRREHGTYCGLNDLVEADIIPGEWLEAEVRGDVPYEFEIDVEGDTFTATARHRTRPGTRRSFRVGPDCQVKPIEDGGR